MEVYQSHGISGDIAHQAIEIMKVTLSRTSPEDIKPYQQASLKETLILQNYDADDFRAILGINVFDDVTWFNKEAFEKVLFYAPLFLIAESIGAFEEVKPVQKTAAGKKQEEHEKRKTEDKG
jgi:hypothetical protein